MGLDVTLFLGRVSELFTKPPTQRKANGKQQLDFQDFFLSVLQAGENGRSLPIVESGVRT